MILDGSESMNEEIFNIFSNGTELTGLSFFVTL